MAADRTEYGEGKQQLEERRSRHRRISDQGWHLDITARIIHLEAGTSETRLWRSNLIHELDAHIEQQVIDCNDMKAQLSSLDEKLGEVLTTVTTDSAIKLFLRRWLVIITPIVAVLAGIWAAVHYGGPNGK